ncbi:hypothetical protein FisN_3Hh562 [Fistulifera solaris]|uniref:Uncharacterized protein n=1 Tax=Fistulifera solaris TaxID=1519565 RepID=A0A1Z5K3P1_FISSO|nr:hypothetical protein FisN_3Hh562 [Fistulifera solaris]|eukprot:GAX20588.1 hypothetical protein FisN_3Hh562 [Fistulifera solaris]
MKIAIAASLIASAAAFAPVSQQAARSTALNAYENELGVQTPTGFYDPLGMLNNASQARFDRLREVEIKHGRVCMLAVAGYLVTYAGIRLPGNIDYAGTKFADIPYGFGALEAVPKGGLAQIVAFIFFLELIMRPIVPGEFIGDFRNGAIDFGWDTFDAETKLKKRAIELNNGRAAQMGILGLMIHEKLGNLDLILPSP